MSNVKWTSSQENAICAHGSSLLVSAAAGSGKTAVLVERLIRRIVNERLDVTQFLIITYTKAAASELRKKISQALLEKIEQLPGDRHLRRQLALVGSARISTVHSFCSWVLRNFSDEDSFPSDFRILEEAEGEVILNEVLTELIEEKYEEREDDFLSLAKYMSDGRGDRLLFSSVRGLFQKSRSQPYPEKWLSSAADEYSTDGIKNISETVWGKEMMSRARDIIDLSLSTLSLFEKETERDGEAYVLYADFLADAISDIKACRSDDWNVLFENTLNLKLKNLPSSRGLTNKTFSEAAKKIFETIRADLKSIPESLLLAESEVLLSEMRALSPIVSSLSALAAELSRRFEKEKLRRGVL
ncbi:MAG: UvrD-helicase domain-containing protein, partial [Oscillospiraceae bacterium]|nr:UvrD-helicase domain-containing protein [Oscillospiraceae bacterium]